MLEKFAADQLFQHLDHIEQGRLTFTTPDGKTRVFEGSQPGENARIDVRDWRMFTNIIRKGDIGFADDYRAGYWETDDLPALLSLALANRDAFDRFIFGNSLSRLIAILNYVLRWNTPKGSKKNIHAHYDLGNDFYSLWLDPSMTYSAALFQKEGQPLEQAQRNKYDRIINCLGSSSGDLLEIGCGWGGFAERALERGDFGIKGITLSREQQDYARRRLDRKADIALEDYRRQTGCFDHIVSIEMFEAVGERYWPAYFDRLAALLKRGGKAVMQTITINDGDFARYRRSGDFIRSYIFPGGMLPSPSRLRQEADRAGLKPHNEFYFGQDYARTLGHWLETFENKCDQVKALGFDDGFIRLWRLYLAACIAGFKTGRNNVMQVEFSHA